MESFDIPVHSQEWMDRLRQSFDEIRRDHWSSLGRIFILLVTMAGVIKFAILDRHAAIVDDPNPYSATAILVIGIFWTVFFPAGFIQRAVDFQEASNPSHPIRMYGRFLRSNWKLLAFATTLPWGILVAASWMNPQPDPNGLTGIILAMLGLDAVTPLLVFGFKQRIATIASITGRFVVFAVGWSLIPGTLTLTNHFRLSFVAPIAFFLFLAYFLFLHFENLDAKPLKKMRALLQRHLESGMPDHQVAEEYRQILIQYYDVTDAAKKSTSERTASAPEESPAKQE